MKVLCLRVMTWRSRSEWFVDAGVGERQRRRRKRSPSRERRGPVTQGRPENDEGADRTERETASHATYLLRRQPATGRSDEGAAGRDDRAQSEGHSRLVSEQAMQGQEAQSAREADAAAAGEGGRSFLFIRLCPRIG